MKSLILYYSYTGNTKKIAEMIHKQLGGDIAQIETVIPYTGSYNDVVNQGQDEVRQGYMPQIKPISIDMSQYDTIILGTPVWWYTFAPAVKTFINNNDLSGKKIYPFITNGGWIGHTEKDIQKECTGAIIEKAINIKFNGKSLSTSQLEIDKWINNIN